jgi:hypothetical protein
MSADGTGGAGGGEIQFDKVDLVAPAEARSCPICKLPITGEYFQIGQAIICARCAKTLGGSQEGRGMFLRALLFGAGAALLGTIVWFAVIQATNAEWGLLAIGVGLIVGRAVKRGGRGLGGWRYQALAMGLTYASITGAHVPFVLSQFPEASAGLILGLAFAKPFTSGSGNIMGIIIIGIGLYEAWKINRLIPLSGPFRFGPAGKPIIATPGGAPPPATIP